MNAVQKVEPNSRTLEVRGRVVDITEMDNRLKALWANLHIEAALIRLRFRVVQEAEVDQGLFDLYQQASPGASVDEYLAIVNAPKDGVGDALHSLLAADDVLACMAIERATGDATDDVARFVVGLTGSEKAAIIAAQNAVNELSQLAQGIDLRNLLARRIAAEEA